MRLFGTVKRKKKKSWLKNKQSKEKKHKKEQRNKLNEDIIYKNMVLNGENLSIKRK